MRNWRPILGLGAATLVVVQALFAEPRATILPREGGKIFPTQKERDARRRHPASFSSAEWRAVRDAKEAGTFQEGPLIPEIAAAIVFSTMPAIPSRPETGGIVLPYETRLLISGRKSIKMSLAKSAFFMSDKEYEDASKGLNKTRPKTPPAAPPGFDMKQELQVRIQGKVGKKITVNVDYDDTREDKRDIFVEYRGFRKGEVVRDAGVDGSTTPVVAQKDEFIQRAAFGDITISLPQTEFLGYSKAVFGAQVEAKVGRVKMMAIGSRSKGLTEVAKFTGNVERIKKEVKDVAYVRRRYYSLKFRPNDLPIRVGSEAVYRFIRTGIPGPNAVDLQVAAGPNDEPLGVNYDAYGGTAPVKYEKLSAVRDYVVDYEKGVISFRTPVQQNDVIAVDFTGADGARLLDQGTAGRFKILKDEIEILAGAHELRNRYFLDNKIIRREINDFILKLRDRNNDSVSDVVTPSYLLDVDAGLLIFDNQFPFASGPDPFPGINKGRIYSTTNPESFFTMDVEYKRRVKIYNLRPGVVLQSERVIVDGRPLTRDVDYFIDYDLGQITFHNPDLIKETTTIEVTYEYSPFGSQFQQTLLGFRTMLDLGELTSWLKAGSNFGSTVMYSFTSKPLTAPNVRSTPNSITVLDADGVFHLQPRDWPLRTTLFGEAGVSFLDTNTFGRAIIENMEGIKQADTVGTLKDLWHVASNPTPGQKADPRLITLTNRDISVRDINPRAVTAAGESGLQQALYLNYKNMNAGQEASIVFPVSNVGLDYTRRTYVEMYVNGDGSGARLAVSLGRMNEDVDGQGGFAGDAGFWTRGQPKTEDLDANGVVGPGEDIGWPFTLPDGSITRVGAGNGRVDSEDLDGDRSLTRTDSVDNFYSDMSTGWDLIESDTQRSIVTTVNWTGWKRLVVRISSAAAQNLTAVKQVRLTVTGGGSGSGQIGVTGMSVVENRFNQFGVIGTSGTVDVQAVNNEDTPGYVPLYSSDVSQNPPEVKSVYEELYPTSVGTSNQREQALALIYTGLAPNATAYAQFTQTKALDLTKHRKLNFFVFRKKPAPGEAPDGTVVFLRIGANDNAYFDYQVPASRVPAGRWVPITLNLVRYETRDGVPKKVEEKGAPRPNALEDPETGTPYFPTGDANLAAISVVRVGVRNTNSVGGPAAGEVWFDDIHMSDPVTKVGFAYKAGTTLDLKNWADATYTRRVVDRNFETITSGSSKQEIATTRSVSGGQDLTSQGVSGNFRRIRYVPVTAGWTESVTVTPSAINTPFSALDEGRVYSQAVNGGLGLKFPKTPQIDTSGNLALTDTNALQKMERTRAAQSKGTYNTPRYLPLPGGYEFPLSPILPESINGGYRISQKDTDFAVRALVAPNFERFVFEETQSWDTSLQYSPLQYRGQQYLSVRPSYGLSETRTKKYLFNAATSSETAPLGSGGFTSRPFVTFRQQQAGVGANLNLFRWFAPQASYNTTVTEQVHPFSFDISTPVQVNEDRITSSSNTVSREASGSLSWNFPFREFVPWLSPTRSFSILSQGSFQDGDRYQYVPQNFETLRRLDRLILRKGFIIDRSDEGKDTIRTMEDDLSEFAVKGSSVNNRGQLIDYRTRNNFKETVQWTFLDWITFPDYLKPFNSLRPVGIYDFTADVSSASGKKVYSDKRNWPNVAVNMNGVERIALLPLELAMDLAGRFTDMSRVKRIALPQSHISNSDTQVSYSFFDEYVRETSQKKTLARGGYTRFKLFRRLDMGYDLRYNGTLELVWASSGPHVGNYVDNTVAGSTQHSVNVGITFGSWRFTPSWTYSRSRKLNVGTTVQRVEGSSTTAPSAVPGEGYPLLEDSDTHIPALDIYADIGGAGKLKLPFFRNPIDLQNRLIIRIGGKWERKRDRVNAATGNTDRFTESASVDYDATQNLKLSFGIDVVEFYNRNVIKFMNGVEEKELRGSEDYWSVAGRLAGELRF